MTDELKLEEVNEGNEAFVSDVADSSFEAFDDNAEVELSAEAADDSSVDDSDNTDVNAEANAEKSAEAAESAEDAADKKSTAEDEVAEVDPTDAGAIAVAEFSKKLRTLEGKWYVLHTYSGYEKRVKANVESRVQNFGLKIRFSRLKCQWKKLKSTQKKVRKLLPACAYRAMC